MTNILDTVGLTRIYKEANGELEGKAGNSNNENLVADFEFMQQVLDNDKGEPSRYAGTGEDDGAPV